MLDLKTNTFLSQEQIKDKAKSIFAVSGASHTSEKYSHIPTFKVIEDMEKLGWGVTDVKEVKARKNAGYQKHLVVFRNPEISIDGADGDTVFPQILLTNSSDGKNAFTFKAGLFRLVCENGLVISTQDFADMRIRHMGYDFNELQKTITEMVEKLPLTVEAMNKFKRTQLNENQMVDFAKKALEARFSEDEVKRIQIDFNEFLKPTRKEDEGDDLWSVFNRVQEKIIEGDFNYSFSSRVRKARRIKNFNQDLVVNSKLYELANEYCLG
jgi:hypothetical protein